MTVGNKPEAGGPALIDRDFIRGLAEGNNQESKKGFTAHAGGTKAAAIELPTGRSFLQVDVCATNGDSALMPQAKAGMWCCVANFGAATMSLYGKGTDTINEAATANAYSLVTEGTAMFFCAEDGKWAAIKSA